MEKKKITIFYQDGEGGSGAYYTGDTIAEAVNSFSRILKDSMRYYVKKDGICTFEIMLRPSYSESDKD